MPSTYNFVKHVLFAVLLCVICTENTSANLADPLPIGMQETWFLAATDRDDQARAERRNWKTGKVDQFILNLPTHTVRKYRRHYALAANRHGLWLAENTLALMRPDGSLERIDNFFPEPPQRGMSAYEWGDQSLLIPLHDDSVLLLRKLSGETKGRAFRLHWRNQAIVAQELREVPAFNYGIAAVRLADGRVLLACGYTGENRAWLYDPRDNRWTATGNLGVGRMYPALAALPDGRAFIAGSSWEATASDNNDVRINSTFGAELFDSATSTWSRLPNLPLSFRINAYGANGPSATVMPDGSLVMGGAMHSRLLILAASGKDFAPYWRISDPVGEQRVGGIVQAIGKDEVAISGGSERTKKGGCYNTLLDSERVHLPRRDEARRSSVGLQRADAASAYRGKLSFVAGGWEAFMLSTATTQASAVAELVDQQNGKVRDLASLPSPMLTGKALWLDDDRIIVKAVSHPARYEQSFRGMDGRSLEFDSAGYLTVYSLKRDTWRSFEEASIAQAELAGRADNEVLLVDGAAHVWAFDPETFALHELPRPTQMRKGGIQRVLADGRVILAGGTAQSELLEAYDADCRRSDCPLKYFAYGALQASRNHETYFPEAKHWELSAPSRGSGESAIIRGDGRVMSLGRLTAGEAVSNWLIEQSDAEGKHWQQISFPAGLAPENCDDSSLPQDACRLLLGEHIASGIEIVLLIHQNGDWQSDLWLYDDSGKWLAIARDLSPGELTTGKIKLRAVGDKTLYGTYFQPQQLRLSLE